MFVFVFVYLSVLVKVSGHVLYESYVLYWCMCSCDNSYVNL